MRILVSCLSKFWAFALAEQLQKHEMLGGFYTAYAWQKNRLMRRFAKRLDKEVIDAQRIHTNIPIAILTKAIHREFLWIELFDRWVARSISRRNDYDVFVGWSGMSLHSIRAAKQSGKITVLERGSSHIEYQNAILQEEYKKYGQEFAIDVRVVKKELLEYAACDFIAVPSDFVRNTFLERGFRADKLILNPFGAAHIFQRQPQSVLKTTFKILYLGSLVRRKGLIYLFEALHTLDFPSDQFEVWFIGSIADEMKPDIERYQQTNWTFFGHVLHHELPALVAQCDVAVQPSVEEGLSMVIPQMLGCGVPVIATTNTGGENIIRDGESGYIVPIRSPEAIAEKIQLLYNQPALLAEMKNRAAESVRYGYTWDDYGNRYVQFLNQLTTRSTP